MKRLAITCTPTMAVNDPVLKTVQQTFRVYPNPARDEIILSTDCPVSGDYLLMDMTGRLLMHSKLTGTKTILPISNLDTGMYLLQIISGNSRFNTLVQCGR